jgi:hypothetical protein
MKIHTGEKPYSFHLCASAFVVQSSQKYHMKVHTGENPEYEIFFPINWIKGALRASRRRETLQLYSLLENFQQ